MEVQQRHDPKRLVAVPTAIAMLLASIYPPFHSADNSSIGYFFLFSAPEYGSIDIGKLVVEYVLVAAIGILAWLLHPWNAAIEKVAAFKIPPYAIRIFRFFGKAALAVLVIAPYAIGKVLGPVTLIIYGGAAILYLIGKFILPAPKKSFLLVASVMGTQAFWILAGEMYLLVGNGKGEYYLDSSKTNWVVATILMGVAYLATIGWFVGKTTLQSAVTLFIWVGLLLYVYSSNSLLGTEEIVTANGVVLQILTFSIVLLLIPLTYYEYSKSRLPNLALADEKTQVDQSVVAKSPLIEMAVTAVCLAATAAIVWAVYSPQSFRDEPVVPSLRDYFSQSTTGNPDFSYDVGGARKAGVSDASIADHLATRLGSNVASARAAGYSDKEIVDTIAEEQTKTDALTKVYPNWREIVGAVDSPEKADPKNPFRKWLKTQPGDYAKEVTSTHSASVLAKAIDKYQAEKAKAAVSSPPVTP